MQLRRALLTELEQYPRLSWEDAAPLIPRAQAGDLAARNTLLLGHWRLVFAIIKKHFPGESIADVFAAGQLGLNRAIDLFDPSFDTKLSTYAYKFIKGAISRSLWAPPRTHELDPEADVRDERDSGMLTRDIAATVLASVSERDRQVLMLRFGLDGKPPRSFDQLGVELGITAEWARQLYEAAIQRARVARPLLTTA